MNFSYFKKSFLALILSSISAFGLDFYISPSGSDSNSGSINSPWKTIYKAQGHIRAINSSMTEDINVYLREGVYYLNRTLKFTPEDSGSNNFSINYMAYRNEVAVISGGVPVSNWTQHSGNIYKATLNRSTKLRQLYVNGARAFMSRTSLKIGAQGGYGSYNFADGENGGPVWAETASAGTMYDGIKFNASDLPSLSRPQDAELTYANDGAWRQYIVGIRGVTSSNGKSVALMQQPQGAWATNYWNATMAVSGDYPKNLYHVWNAYELLDEPGEFYFNPSTKELFYYKHNTTDMSKAQIIAPMLEKLIDISGVNKTNHVENLSFKKLVFAHNHWSLNKIGESEGWISPQSVAFHYKYSAGLEQRQEHKGDKNNDGSNYEAFDYYDVQSAAIEIYNSTKINFTKSTFQNIGSIGLSFVNDVHNSSVTASQFFDIGSAAVNVGHPQHRWVKGKGSPLFPANSEDACNGISVTHNVLRDIGAEVLMAPALTAFYVRNTSISNNDIHSTPYSGISLGWDWESHLPKYDAGGGLGEWGLYNKYDQMSDTMYGNSINKNRIMNACMQFKDGGSIYTLGEQNPNANSVGEAADSDWSEMDGNFVISMNGAGIGYYADEGSQYWKVSNSMINGGAWFTANPGTRDILMSSIKTGIGFNIPKADVDKNFVESNIDHGAPGYNYPDFQGSREASIWNNSGVQGQTKVPQNLSRSLSASDVSYSSQAKKSPASIIDGNPEWYDNRFDTNVEANPWVQFDLGSSKEIDHIVIWNKWYTQGNASPNLKDFYVFVSDSPISGSNPATIASRSNVWSHFHSGMIQTGLEQAGYPSNRSGLVRIRQKGRYVRIQLTANTSLQLQEVEIYENLMKKLPAGDIIAPGDNPVVTITAPQNNSTYDEGISVTFTGTATDTEDGDLSGSRLVWNSSINGQLGTGSSLNVNNLSVGMHTISLTATDSDHQIDSHSIELEVKDILKDGENLALKGTVSQSSTYAPASRAIDGNTDGAFSNGSVSHTEGNAGAAASVNDWLQLDLGAEYYIGSINLWNRTDAALDALKDYHVIVSKTAFSGDNLNTALSQAVWKSGLQSERAGRPTSFTVNASGRYIRVQLTNTNDPVTIAEIEVLSGILAPNTPPEVNILTPSNGREFDEGVQLELSGSGSDTEDGVLSGSSLVWQSSIDGILGSGSSLVITDLSVGDHRIKLTATDSDGATATKRRSIVINEVVKDPPRGINLALKGTPRQSSSAYGGTSDRAIDGNTDGRWAQGSVTHTDTTSTYGEWFEIDLGSEVSLNKINLFNRVESSERLKNYYVFISSTPFTDSDVTALIGESSWTSGLVTEQAGFPTIFTMNTQGRYVRVQLRDADIPLSIAEIEVIGGSSSSVVNDLTGDGKSDLVWRNQETGQTTLWEMDGGTRLSFSNIAYVSPDWDLSLADLTGDGKSDMIWRDSQSGRTTMWEMDGGSQVSFSDFGYINTDWQLLTGDLTGDGKSDLVWRNQVTGQTTLWEMNGGARLSFSNITYVSPDWDLSNADLTGDGKSDLVWRDSQSGRTTMWEMDGGSQVSFNDFGYINTDWQVIKK